MSFFGCELRNWIDKIIVTKSLDEKIARIRANPTASKDFILADAKDADMAFGLTAPGPVRAHEQCGWCESVGRYKTLESYRQQIRSVIEQGLVDVMLLSASNVEQLVIKEQRLASSSITPAARANDTSDIWVVRGGKYPAHPSRPFRTATIDHIKYGHLTNDHHRPVLGADLGLYSITFTNNIDWDYRSLEDFHEFRIEAEKKGFRYFLEVFNPNVHPEMPPKKVAGFLNDHIVRTLAGVTERGRPLFLKLPYHGPEALSELVCHDPSLIVGVMGGSAGTTMDAFQLIYDVQQHGGRAALFGRKINLSEHPLSFLEMLHRIVNDDLKPAEAVKAYHAELEKLKIKPDRTLQRDLQQSQNSMQYG